MWSRISLLLLIALLVSCRDSDTLVLEPLVFSGSTCELCPEVKVVLPAAFKKSRIGNVINTALREEVIALLNYDDAVEAKDIPQAIEAFSNGYHELQELYAGETVGWEAKITGSVTFEDHFKITIKLDSYLFTGGAHGYGSTRFLNFDKKKGREMEAWELFSDREEFTRFAELKFRDQEQIPLDRSINSTGYMFEKDSFYLPENIGFTSKGVQLIYNQYEVASFADGPVEVNLPHSEVKPYLSGNLKS